MIVVLNHQEFLFPDFSDLTEIHVSIARKFLDLNIETSSPDIPEPERNFWVYFHALCLELSQYKNISKKAQTFEKQKLAHNQFAQYLDTNIEVFRKYKRRIEILGKYAQSVKRPLFSVANDLISNQHSITSAHTAQTVLKNFPEILKKNCLEVGAGTSPLVRMLGLENCQNYSITDLKPEYLVSSLKNPIFKYDFDAPLETGPYDAILATKALHLAKNRKQTLHFLNSGLNKSGLLINGAVSKYSVSGERFPLEFTFSFFPGFTEVGGLFRIDEYSQLVEETNFKMLNLDVITNANGHRLFVAVSEKI